MSLRIFSKSLLACVWAAHSQEFLAKSHQSLTDTYISSVGNFLSFRRLACFIVRIIFGRLYCFRGRADLLYSVLCHTSTFATPFRIQMVLLEYMLYVMF